MDYWIEKIKKVIKMPKREKREFEANGKSLSKEKTIYQTLKEMIGTDTKVYYIMWKFCPEYLPYFLILLRKKYVRNIF